MDYSECSDGRLVSSLLSGYNKTIDGKLLFYNISNIILETLVLNTSFCASVSSSGVGKSSLLLRFADNTFSGQWFYLSDRGIISHVRT